MSLNWDNTIDIIDDDIDTILETTWIDNDTLNVLGMEDNEKLFCYYKVQEFQPNSKTSETLWGIAIRLNNGTLSPITDDRENKVAIDNVSFVGKGNIKNVVDNIKSLNSMTDNTIKKDDLLKVGTIKDQKKQAQTKTPPQQAIEEKKPKQYNTPTKPKVVDTKELETVLAECYYLVKKGDTLKAIAQKLLKKTLTDIFCSDGSDGGTRKVDSKQVFNAGTKSKNSKQIINDIKKFSGLKGENISLKPNQRLTIGFTNLSLLEQITKTPATVSIVEKDTKVEEVEQDNQEPDDKDKKYTLKNPNEGFGVSKESNNVFVVLKGYLVELGEGLDKTMNRPGRKQCQKDEKGKVIMISEDQCLLEYPRSGVTIGMGYDLGQRGYTSKDMELVRTELGAAGFSEPQITILMGALGKKGHDANDYIDENKGLFTPITPLMAYKLLYIKYSTHEDRVEKFVTHTTGYYSTFSKEHLTVEQWQDLDDTIKELLIDMDYHGILVAKYSYKNEDIPTEDNTLLTNIVSIIKNNIENTEKIKEDLLDIFMPGKLVDIVNLQTKKIKFSTTGRSPFGIRYTLSDLKFILDKDTIDKHPTIDAVILEKIKEKKLTPATDSRNINRRAYLEYIMGKKIKIVPMNLE